MRGTRPCGAVKVPKCLVVIDMCFEFFAQVDVKTAIFWKMIQYGRFSHLKTCDQIRCEFLFNGLESDWKLIKTHFVVQDDKQLDVTSKGNFFCCRKKYRDPNISPRFTCSMRLQASADTETAASGKERKLERKGRLMKIAKKI